MVCVPFNTLLYFPSSKQRQHEVRCKCVYTTQIPHWLANGNFLGIHGLPCHVIWHQVQAVLMRSIQLCPSPCIAEPSGHLFTNKPLMAQIFTGLSLWHGIKCLHLSTRFDMLLVSHQNPSFTGKELRGVKTWPNPQC